MSCKQMLGVCERERCVVGGRGADYVCNTHVPKK